MRILLSALSRHRSILVLLLISVSVTNAVVINALVMISDRLRSVQLPSGFDETGLLAIFTTAPFDKTGDAAQSARYASYRDDVAAIKAIPGVQFATALTGLPYYSGTQIDVSKDATTGPQVGIQATLYSGGIGTVKALGLDIIQGSDFNESSFVQSKGLGAINEVSEAIVSLALAKKFFADEHFVGRQIFVSGHAITITGVTSNLSSLNPTLGGDTNDLGLLLPMFPDGLEVVYALRVRPSDVDRILSQSRGLIHKRNPTRVIEKALPFSEIHMQYYQHETSMIRILVASSLTLIFISMAGMLGLFTYWISHRTRSIGIRRALGATRKDIAIYFSLENLIVSALGSAIGILGALFLNSFISRYTEISSVDLQTTLACSAALIAISQGAGLYPIIKAAIVEPAVVTKTI